MISAVWDKVTLWTHQNTFYPPFIDVSEFFLIDKEADDLGVHYHYFSCFSTMLESFGHKAFYKPAKDYFKADDATAKAIYFLGRGMTVIFLMFSLGFFNTELFYTVHVLKKTKRGALWVVLSKLQMIWLFGSYYCAHAVVALAPKCSQMLMPKTIMGYDVKKSVDAMKKHLPMKKKKLLQCQTFLLLMLDGVLSGYLFYLPLMHSHVNWTLNDITAVLAWK